MESYISIIKFVNNPISKESIAVGLIIASADRIYYRVSKEKLNFAKKLNPEYFTLFKFSLNKLTDFLEKDAKEHQAGVHLFRSDITKEYLNRLAIYQNGILGFSDPESIDKSFNRESFDVYFRKMVDPLYEADPESIQVATKPSILKKKIDKDLYAPLANVVDVDYTLKSKQIPSLFFDFHLEAIGVNGSFYTVKALDFNIDSVDKLKRQIVNYESVIDRLNMFGKEHGIEGENKWYLVADKPQDVQSLHKHIELYHILKEENDFLYEIVSSSQLKNISETILHKKATKFSSLLNQVA